MECLQAPSKPTLPNELIIEIISYLTDRYTLWSFCLVSRSFNDFATPLLYRTYKNRRVGLKAGQQRPFGPFLRTVVKRPELALHVKRLEIGPWATFKQTKNKDRCNFLNHDVPDRLLLLETGKRVGLGTATLQGGSRAPEMPWSKLFARGCEDAEVVLLLHLLGNVEELVVSFPEGHMFQWKNWIAHQMPRLTYLRLEGPKDRHPGVDLARLGQLLSVPALKRFEAYSASDDDYVIRTALLGEDVDQVSSNIEIIRLEDSALSQEGFEVLVGACKELKVFEYTHQGPIYFDPEVMMANAMEKHSLSLRRLKLGLLDKGHRWEEAGEPNSRISSLDMFWALEEVDIEQEILIGQSPLWTSGDEREQEDALLVEAIPSSLREIVLRRCNEAIRGQLISLHHHAEEFPNLRKLEILLSEGDGKDMDMVKELFEAQGIRFSWGLRK